jgi:hypothetical protein
MGLKILISKRKTLLFALILFLFANNFVQGQSWSIEHVLRGDSSVYKLSQDKIIQGNPVDFFFPAYKFNQTSTTKVIESVYIENNEIIEIEFDSNFILCDKIDFEIYLYAESVDTIRIFLKTADNHLVPIRQQIVPKGYFYLPTIFFSVNLEQDNLSSRIMSIQIVGNSKDKSSKLILGRLNGLKKIEFVTENMQTIDSFVSKYPFEQQSDIFYELPARHLKLRGFYGNSRLVLKDCHSAFDSIQCISQFTDKLLNEYVFYDVYGINKDDLLNRNALLTKTVPDIDSYYKGMKEIIASLNCCHIRLTTNQIELEESPLQPIYFYNIKNEIVVTAIFDPTLNNTIQLGDKLLSINNTPLEQLYKDFSKYVFASTPHQREMKITQRLLYTAMETYGDNILLEFQNNMGIYSTYLSKANFFNKRIVPSGFKVASNNMIEKNNNIIYFRPNFMDFSLNPFMYSYKEDFNNCEGLIVDLRGNSGGDLSCYTLFSFLISEDSPTIYHESYFYNVSSNYIVKPSNKIQIQAPIVVIVDARTTCVGEFLINALRKSKSDIYVIGSSNTAGSAQLVITTILPNNASLAHFDGITKDAFGHVIDDNIGIAPDALIRFESYQDLFPYEDSLKRIAMEYLKHKIESIIKEDIQY